jgi:DNA-binding SARP family transcriptional activator
VVLAILLCNANSIVPVTELLEALWGDNLPRTAQKNLQVYVSNLRRMLFPGSQAGRLAYHPPGYQLSVRPDELDLLRFEDDARSGRGLLRAGDIAGAARMLRRALSAWRADALTDLCSVSRVGDEADRLDTRRLSVYEDWIEAELSLGHSLAALDVIEELAAKNPMRERLRSAQMLALYRTGRRAEALAEYDNLRQMLARELGLQPSPPLARLYQAILGDDPALTAPPPLPTPRHAPRDVVAHVVQLPPDLEDFTGRRAEVASLSRALGADTPGAHLVVVSGAPGIGKTALALHTAHLLRPRFPDGQLFIRMRSADGRIRTPSGVLAELLGMFGLDHRLPRVAEARAALYRAWLAERRLLIILDGVRDEPQVRPLLPGAGGTRMVVTSRRHLGGLEAARHLEIGPVSVAEATELMGKISGQHAAQDRADAERVVRSCGLVPYPIRICGAKLEAGPHRSLRRLADSLAFDDRLLDELTIGDLSIRACCQAYLQDVTPADRATALRLGRLADDTFGLAELADLLNCALEAAENSADRLIENRFVTAASRADADGGIRYEIPRWLRLYLREQVGVSPAHALPPGGDMGAGRRPGVARPGDERIARRRRRRVGMGRVDDLAYVLPDPGGGARPGGRGPRPCLERVQQWPPGSCPAGSPGRG